MTKYEKIFAALIAVTLALSWWTGRTLQIIDVAGLKKSGKTTVVENIVTELKSRGFKTGTE